MFHNIKVDVVYYKTNTDFEMEFNLCGCCRMRLLTDKAPDQKALVHSLARAVSRSQIVLIVGSLFGNEGTIKTVARSLNSTLSLVNNKEYGIATDDEIEIIVGATPLVTADGLFGGCIIESGPQTMILVSDSKNVRKSVMQNLIHPYIEELCALELHQKASEKTAITEDDEEAIEEPITEEILEAEIVDEGEVIEDGEATTILGEITEEDAITEDGEGIKDTVVEDATEDEPAVTVAGEVEPDDDDGTVISESTDDADLMAGGIEIAPEFVPILETEYSFEPEDRDTDDILFAPSTFEDIEETDTIVSDFDDENQPYFYEYERAHKKSKTNLSLLIVSILLLVAIAILCFCIFYIPSKDGTSPTAYIKEIFDTLFG